MATRRFWPYLRATYQVGFCTVVVLLASAIMLFLACAGLGGSYVLAAAAFAGHWAAMVFAAVFGLMGLAALKCGWRMLAHYFGRRPGSDLAWEWPSEIVRREERERQEARKGIELIASEPVEGSGTELEAGAAPQGTGTELSAGGVTDGPAPTSDSGGEPTERAERA